MDGLYEVCVEIMAVKGRLQRLLIMEKKKGKTMSKKNVRSQVDIAGIR